MLFIFIEHVSTQRSPYLSIFLTRVAFNDLIIAFPVFSVLIFLVLLLYIKKTQYIVIFIKANYKKTKKNLI